MKSLMLTAALALFASAAQADTANSDWNDSASFMSNGDELVLLERFRLRQQLPEGFANITNMSIGSIINVDGDNNSVTGPQFNDDSSVNADQNNYMEVYD